MARAQEKQGITSAYSPIRENELAGHDEMASATGCDCFRFCCLGSKQSNQEVKYLLQQQNGEPSDSLLLNKLNKLKEFLELVVGPKWKNFIRKTSNYCNPKMSKTRYIYSPQSYALNFDDGKEEDDLFTSFSSRFSAPVANEQQRRTTSS